jgi:hypothetical protein
MRLYAVLGLAIALPASPCWAQPKPLADTNVKVDFDKTVDFSKYKLFAWVPFQEPAANPANHIRITRAVEAALVGKGLLKTEAGEEPDVYVHVQGTIEKKRPSTSGPAESPWNATPNQQWKVDFDVKKVEVGTLVVELWDGRTKDIVWRSKGEALIPRVDLVEEVINASVKKLFAEYPPKP